ncbi:hypothetical protein JHK82_031840 [Glycine max]|nr:hypothetical protein JHK82_031840 [Glycine max]
MENIETDYRVVADVVVCIEIKERNQKRKRLRYVSVKDPRISAKLNGGIRGKLGSALDHRRSRFIVPEKETSHHHHYHHQQPNRLTRLEKLLAIVTTSTGKCRRESEEGISSKEVILLSCTTWRALDVWCVEGFQLGKVRE